MACLGAQRGLAMACPQSASNGARTPYLVSLLLSPLPLVSRRHSPDRMNSSRCQQLFQRPRLRSHSRRCFSWCPCLASRAAVPSPQLSVSRAEPAGKRRTQVNDRSLEGERMTYSACLCYPTQKREASLDMNDARGRQRCKPRQVGATAFLAPFAENGEKRGTLLPGLVYKAYETNASAVPASGGSITPSGRKSKPLQRSDSVRRHPESNCSTYALYLAKICDIDGCLIPGFVQPFSDLHDGSILSVFQPHHRLPHRENGVNAGLGGR